MQLVVTVRELVVLRLMELLIGVKVALVDTLTVLIRVERMVVLVLL